jgi:hypothetical protein
MSKPIMILCPTCAGSCIEAISCRDCYGAGQVRDGYCVSCGQEWELGPAENLAECEKCRGDGVEEIECTCCNGTGEIEAEVEDIKHMVNDSRQG